MGIKCILGFHTWNEFKCMCSVCYKRRDEHDWSKDCEKCFNCGQIQKNQHDWVGCKCSKCGETRDEQHDWIKDDKKCYKCTICKKEQHEWSRDSKFCMCIKCGLKKKHLWSEGYSGPLIKCSRCDDFYSIIGKTVVAAKYSLMAPLNKASAHDRSFHCTGEHPWGGCSGYWLIDGTPGSTASFCIEKVLD